LQNIFRGRRSEEEEEEEDRLREHSSDKSITAVEVTRSRIGCGGKGHGNAPEKDQRNLLVEKRAHNHLWRPSLRGDPKFTFTGTRKEETTILNFLSLLRLRNTHIICPLKKI
jgi:hypothetical protein